MNSMCLLRIVEGFLETFILENPGIYDTIRLIIFEEDYKEKCNYNNIKKELKLRNFIKLIDGIQNVWIRKKIIWYYY